MKKRKRVPVLSPRQERSFWRKVCKTEAPVLGRATTPCWVWTGAKMHTNYNYGQVNLHPHGLFLAHVVSLVLSGVTQPQDHEDVAHSCDNPPCVRPDHLSFGTHKDNMVVVRGDLCPRGHPYSIRPDDGSQRCLVCNAVQIREAYRIRMLDPQLAAKERERGRIRMRERRARLKHPCSCGCGKPAIRNYAPGHNPGSRNP